MKYRNSNFLLYLAVVIGCCIATPALADTKYIGGSPDLSAYISSVNEFTAGSDIIIPVSIQNSGISTSKQVGSAVVAPDIPPTTAKFVTVKLSNGNAPIDIKSDSQMIGDIPGQGIVNVNFAATVNADAPAGTYMLPVEINYSTLYAYYVYEDISTEKNRYLPDSIILTVPVVIKAEVVPQVISAVPDNLVAGADGYVNVTVQNTGALDGRKATVRLVQAGENPVVVPVDTGVYIGDFPVNNTVSCQFKVSVKENALHKQYPVGIMVVYQNNEGDFVNSRIVTTGVDVGKKVDFGITPSLITLNPGSSNTIQVQYKNTGDSAIRGAEARINTGSPFTISNGVAYLGDLAPGQSANASYQVGVETNAVAKLYGIDTEVRYRDSLDNIYVSDLMKVYVDVKYPTGISAILSNSVAISIIIAALIGIIYVIWHYRGKK